VIADFGQGEVRWEGDRPVAVGEQELALPTRIVRTPGGFWAAYGSGDEVLVVHPGGAFRGETAEVRERLQGIVGDQGRDDADRDAAASFLPLLGDDDPGAAQDVPRSAVESGGSPPTYRLSDPTNSPPNPMPPYSGPEHGTEPPKPGEQTTTGA
jgi:hypothetical protein